MLPVVIGFSGVAIDISHWYMEMRGTQTMADAAAVAATYADLMGQAWDDVVDVATREAVRNGYENQEPNELLVSPSDGNGGTSARIEVVVRREVPLFFGRMFMTGDGITIAARAVAGARNLGNVCVLALDEHAARALHFSGTAVADIGCGVASNSDAANALAVTGNATLSANPAQAFGDLEFSGSYTFISDYPPLPHSPRVADPYADRTLPEASGDCDSNNLTIGPNANVTLTPDGGSYRICGSLTVKGNLELGEGVYYIDGGSLKVNSGASITGTGVTIVLTGATADNVKGADINGQAALNLTAPSSGPYQGVVIYQDRKAPTDGDNKLNGGSNLKLKGTVYFPRQPLTYNGGSDSDGCTQIIARTITFTGNSTVNNELQACAAVGVTPAAGSSQQQVLLVE
jgi:hypothetical protein